MANHPSFGKTVEDNWKVTTNAMYLKRIWLKLKTIKQAIKGLNTKEFSGINDKIKGIRNDLQLLQQQMRTYNQDPYNFDVEKELRS